MTPFVSKTCEGERCHCGEPAVRKVGEEIPFDDPAPNRHNLTAYVCARHYAELMGPLGAEHVGNTRISPCTDEDVERVARAICAVENDGAVDEEILPGTPRWVAFFPEARAAITAMSQIRSTDHE